MEGVRPQSKPGREDNGCRGDLVVGDKVQLQLAKRWHQLAVTCGLRARGVTPLNPLLPTSCPSLNSLEICSIELQICKARMRHFLVGHMRVFLLRKAHRCSKRTGGGALIT